MKRIAVAIMIVVLSSTLFAQIYDKPYKLYQVKTQYFTILFPEPSKKSAYYLASFADAVYEEVAQKLGTKPELTIPVLITPDSESINGFFSSSPIVKIVLYETSISNNTQLSFNNQLYKLFYHELTHFVSLTALNPFIRSLSRLLGGWVFAINQLQIPYNFIEGITVSFESHDGIGRAEDPLPGGQIRQDILESNFKTFVQSMGAWDKYPNHALYYWYGGYFSLYLQKTYGFEPYTKLWKYFSNLINFVPLDDIGLIKGKFKSIYGITLEEAWNNFKEYMSIKTPVYMHTKKLTQEAYYTTIAAHDSAIIAYDAYKQELQELSAEAYKLRPIIAHEHTIERISIHKNGAILLSTYKGYTNFPKQVLELYSKDKITQLPWQKMSDAVWAGDNILAIETENYARNLVLLAGKEKITLLKGTENIIYWNPVSNDDGSVFYVLVSESGKSTILRLCMEGTALKSVQKLMLPPEITWLRYLSYSNGSLYAGWDTNTLYKLIAINDSSAGQSAAVQYETVPMSGGVHYPIQTTKGLYYLGFFSQGRAICMFPENRSNLGFTAAEVSWEDASYLLKAQSAFDTIEPAYPATAYNGSRWLLPAGAAPFFNYNFTTADSELGATIYFSEPTDTVYSELTASINSSFPNAVQMSFLTAITQPSYTIAAQYQDVFAGTFNDEGTFEGYRRSNAALIFSPTLFGVNSLQGTIGAGFSGFSEFAESDTDYYRFWDTVAGGAIARLAFTDTRALFNEPSKYEGYAFSLFYRIDKFIVPDYPVWYTGMEGKLTLALGKPFIEFISEGAFSPNATLYYGPNGFAYLIGDTAYAGISTLTVFPEFASQAYSTWYIQNMLNIRILTAELQRQFLGLYFNRLFIDSGMRAAFAGTPVWISGSALLSHNVSAFACLNVTGGTGFFVIAAVHINIGLELALSLLTYQPGFRLLIKLSM